MSNFYTTIKDAQDNLDDGNLVRCVVDRPGVNMSTPEVITRLERLILRSSRDFDGYARGFMTVPIEPTVTPLTGKITVTNSSATITGVGTLFNTELNAGDEIRLDVDTDVRLHIESITDDLNAIAQFVYHGRITTFPTEFSKYVSNVPHEVEILTRDHFSFVVWARRGRAFKDNPFADSEKRFNAMAVLVQEGRFKFADSADTEISEKPTISDNSAGVFTNDSLDGYAP